MKIIIEKTFERDTDKIEDKKILNHLYNLIDFLNKKNSPHEIQNLKKMEGHKNYYRIRIGNYRIGLKIINNTIYLIRFLHRKDIYK